MIKYNTEWLIKTLQDRNINVTPIEEYIDDKTPIKFRCNICNHEWKVDPSHLKGGRTCPNCKKLQKLENLKQDFIKRSQEIHNNKYNYDKVIYAKQQQKVIITCPIHGDFEQTPMAHLRGQGCPLCAGNNFLRDTKYFIKLANQAHNNNYDYSLVEYQNCKTPITIKCNKCGHIFEQTPDKHLSGQGCPKCNLKAQSELFNKLQNVFNKEELLWEASPDWLEKQRFDIYFPKYNIAIEYDGIQHYVPIEHFGGEIGLQYTQKQDKLKEQKCLEHKCTLFRVKYNYSESDFNQLCSSIKNIIN